MVTKIQESMVKVGGEKQKILPVFGYSAQDTKKNPSRILEENRWKLGKE